MFARVAALDTAPRGRANLRIAARSGTPRAFVVARAELTSICTGAEDERQPSAATRPVVVTSASGSSELLEAPLDGYALSRGRFERQCLAIGESSVIVLAHPLQ